MSMHPACRRNEFWFLTPLCALDRELTYCPDSALLVVSVAPYLTEQQALTLGHPSNTLTLDEEWQWDERTQQTLS